MAAPPIPAPSIAAPSIAAPGTAVLPPAPQGGFAPRLHHLLFIAFTLMAAPILVLTLWANHTAAQGQSVQGEMAALALAAAGMALVASAILSWRLALCLARPVRVVADTAGTVLAGSSTASAPRDQGLAPRENRPRAAALDMMLSDLRREAVEAAEALRQAEDLSEAATHFLANISHEIRTPLNGILGMVESMQLTGLTSAQRRYLETTLEACRSLLRLVDDLLELSMIEDGLPRLDHAPFHLPSLMLDVRTRFAEPARAKGLTVSLLMPDSLNLIVVGDAHRLRQILGNLVGNAVRFTSDGGITMRIAMEQEIGSGMRLRFEISDTGPGIQAARQVRIFDGRTQDDSATTRRHGGTGLGLSIARQLCHVMDGDFGLESVVGVGSTVWFTVFLQRQVLSRIRPIDSHADPGALGCVPLGAVSFGLAASDGPIDGLTGVPRRGATGAALLQWPTPAAPVMQATAAPQAVARAGSPARQAFQAALERAERSTICILVVEDNASNMRVTQALLESLGCHVTTARNGLEAVAAYREGRFDLVLMDCQMPEMNGYEATRTIRRIETLLDRRTMIVALTAHAMAGSREASLASGMDDQLTKPLTMAALTGKLVEWLCPPQVSR